MKHLTLLLFASIVVAMGCKENKGVRYQPKQTDTVCLPVLGQWVCGTVEK